MITGPNIKKKKKKNIILFLLSKREIFFFFISFFIFFFLYIYLYCKISRLKLDTTIYASHSPGALLLPTSSSGLYSFSWNRKPPWSAITSGIPRILFSLLAWLFQSAAIMEYDLPVTSISTRPDCLWKIPREIRNRAYTGVVLIPHNYAYCMYPDFFPKIYTYSLITSGNLKEKRPKSINKTTFLLYIRKTRRTLGIAKETHKINSTMRQPCKKKVLQGEDNSSRCTHV